MCFEELLIRTHKSFLTDSEERYNDFKLTYENPLRQRKNIIYKYSKNAPPQILRQKLLCRKF